MDEIIYASASEIAKAIREKQVSAVEVVDAHLRRIDEVNPKLNAVVQFATDRARREATEAAARLSRGEVHRAASRGAHNSPSIIKSTLTAAGVTDQWRVTELAMASPLGQLARIAFWDEYE